MLPDDPRHGSVAGHAAGCRDDCCDAAKLRYDKRRRLHGPRTTSSVGTVRRIHALQALGYSMPQIAKAGGLAATTVSNPQYRGGSVNVVTADGVRRAYDELSMKLPEGRYAVRNRRLAEKRGWPPPLAWDDDAIDDPDATPHVGTKRTNPHHEQTDERRATLHDLDAWGYGISEACRRLNASRDALEAWAYRHDMQGVYSRLVDRENPAEVRNRSTVERRAG